MFILKSSQNKYTVWPGERTG